MTDNKMDIKVLLNGIDTIKTIILEQSKSHQDAIQKQTKSNERLYDSVTKSMIKIAVVEARIKRNEQDIVDIHIEETGLTRQLKKISEKTDTFVNKLLFIITGASVTMALTLVYELAMRHIHL